VHPTDAEIGTILVRLDSEHAESAWRQFLTSYSELIYGTIRMFAKDVDDAGDCFVYVCEKLAAKRYRRLRAFKTDGCARFSTWLRAVVRNLCLDWLRSRFGRKQPFRAVASLAALDQEIFRSVFQCGKSIQQSWHDLRANGVEVKYSEFEERAALIQNLLTSSQLWLISTSITVFDSLDSVRDPDSQSHIEIEDPSPNPEELVTLGNTHAAVSHAMRHLDQGDRLLLVLRYLQGLSLLDVAALVGLKDAQTADRQIRGALENLRAHLGVKQNLSGKPKSVSV
jgi:RNA polymerase sigma factor (sigma-70 family)